jgi:hypothetical protein
MDDAGEGSRATRQEVLGATASALAVGALPGRSSAQQASGPTVYVGSGFGDETLYAVDAATGTQKWAFTQPSGAVDSSPTVADGTVYIGSEDNTLYAVDADSGEQEWAFTQPSGEVRSSPTVADGTVYVGSYDNTLYAVDAATGSQEWAFTQPSGPVWSSPTVVADPASGDSVGSRVLLGTLGHHGERADRVTTLDPAFFEVSIESVTDPTAGETLDVTVAVENTGEASATQTVELSASGLGTDSTTVSLDGGDSTTETLSLQTSEGDAGEYDATVEAGDGSDSTDVTVLAPAAFTVDITDVTAPVAGDSLAATVSIENTGDTPGEQTIELSASGLGSDSTTVSLDGGDSTTETLSLSTDEDDDGEYTLTADAGDDEATETVTVAAPAGDGLGTTEMAAIGGGGGLALLFGAYALMRRGGDDGDDSTPERPSEPDTPGRGATTPRGSQLSDSGPGDTVDDLLDDVAQTLDSARRARGAGEYDRALARCGRAITTAKEARATARRDAPDLVPDAEDTLDDATTLRETIQAERDARQQTTDALDTAEGALDDAAAALDGGSPEAALETLDGVAGSLDTARASIADHEFPALAERVATLEQRQERLQQAAREARTRVPAEIPGVTRHSLSYADIEKRGELGRGGNADVFRATARTDGGDIDIALKEPRMSGDGTLHTEVVERMIDEAETWQRLDGHDHIVGVVDYGSEPLPWIAMEHMDAGHLGERAGDLPLDQALWTAIATAEGVRHAHRRGVAHLDLKPENVLFRAVADAWNAPKVADWGLSKHLLEHSQSVEGVTPYYAAPEQFADGYGTPDDITDVYQLGAVFYELFTGRPPFEGRPMRVMRQVEFPPDWTTCC